MDTREREALEVLEDFRKGRIGAQMRDDRLRGLGYDIPKKKYHDGWSSKAGGKRKRGLR